MSSDSFEFVRIPADDQLPIIVETADKSGGLTNDALLAHAKEYFAKQQPPQSSIVGLSSVDITAITVPMPQNDYMAVSMYSSASSTGPSNRRAVELLVACGHAASPILGDVFVGRACDNEVADIWERRDFTVEDADPTASWCKLARQGRSSSGKSSASSLSGLLQQQLSGNASSSNGPMQVLGNDKADAGAELFGMPGAPPVKEAWGSWTQSNEDVELKLTTPSDIRGKDCHVSFGKSKLQVRVGQEERLAGQTFEAVDVDDCTYTLEATSDGSEKILCITLAKKQPNQTWPWAVR